MNIILIFTVLVLVSLVSAFNPLTIDAVEETKHNKLAYVMYATDDDRLCSATISAGRIAKWQPRGVDIVVLLLEGLTYDIDAVKNLQCMRNVIVKTVENLYVPGQMTNWGMTWNRYHAFNMTQYQRVLYLDTDVYLLKSLESLFELPSARIVLSQFYWKPFLLPNSMLMLIEPNTTDFNNLMEISMSNHKYSSDVIAAYINYKDTVLSGMYALLQGEFATDQKQYFGSDLQATWDAATNFNFATYSPWSVTPNDTRITTHGPLFEKTFTVWFEGRANYCVSQ
eukprot:gene16879-20071_t